MTHSTTHRECRDCGAPFKKSRGDSTVRCPACRAGGKRAAAREASYKPVACGRCGNVHTTLKCDRCGF